MRSRKLLLTALLLLPACIPLTTPGATGNNIFVYNFFFTPVFDTTLALRNDSVTVTFRWTDSTGAHSIVWDSAPGGVLPDSVPAKSEGTYVVMLATGTYRYHCSIHQAEFGMAGQIVVQPFDTPPPGSSGVLPDPASPVAAAVTRPSPGAAQANPKRAAQRSRPATS
jgi:hypothetical protein